MTIIELQKKRDEAFKALVNTIEYKTDKPMSILYQTAEYKLENLITNEYIALKKRLGTVNDVLFAVHEIDGEYSLGVSVPSKQFLKLCDISEKEKVHNITKELENHPEKGKIFKIAMNYWNNCWGSEDE